MLSILLLNPPFKYRFSREQRSPAVTKAGTFYYPMWLAYATGVLEENGFNAKLIDAPANNLNISDVLKIAEKFNPNLLVISTSTPSIYNDIKVAEKIKSKIQNLKPQVILVGPHVSATPEETLRISRNIDIICRGEYEYTLLDIAKEFEIQNPKLKNILGISYREGDKIIHNSDRPLIENLDAIPFVSKVYKKHLNHTHYFYGHSQYPIVTIVGGRGCTHRCYYCVYPQTFSGRKVRYRSVKNIVDEIEYIVHNFRPLREIMFEDDTLTLNRKRCKELCEEIISRRLKICWSANSRADVDLDTLKIMRKAGCRLLCVGFESGVQKILDNMNKGIKLSTMEEFMKNAKKVGILIHGCFMVGNKGETKETMFKTLEFAKILNPDTAQFFPIMVYPGTEAYRWAKENNYIITNNYREWITEEGLHNCIVSTPNIRANELVNFCDYARKKFYLRPRYLVKKIIQVIRNPNEGKRNFKSFKISAKYLFK
jgi:radical SAM superfamily enzyme YgiQ (UPF0313 family)